MRISDWSSDVCSSDLFARQNHGLRRLWAVDEDDALLRSRRGNIEILPALHVARHAPKTEALLEQRLQFRQASIADRKDLRIDGPHQARRERSEERRGGEVGVRQCRYRGRRLQSKKKTK